MIVSTICNKYKDCEKIIVGYNPGWKTKVRMGKANNRNFYEIPYRLLLDKLGDNLERNNQELVIIEESKNRILLNVML
jgi:putative transposase